MHMVKNMHNIPMDVYSFPPNDNFESVEVLKKLAQAHRYLAELKGLARSIPNEGILIDTLTLQEAKDSSEVENIVTTHDELFKAGVGDLRGTPAAKEVRDYSAALKLGFARVRSTGVLRLNDILEIQAIIKRNNAGLRRLPGTTLKNADTGEIVYEPPQNTADIEQLMSGLVDYLNAPADTGLDPLIRMALMHHQFESIHPFYDGNGRVGRILNILYLVMHQLLDIPILYLSRHITGNKNEYYRLLQLVRDNGSWEEWILFILDGVESTAKETIDLVQKIKTLMMSAKSKIRTEAPKIYSQDLLNNLFRHPYTKIAYLMQDIGVTRVTATKYLEELVEKEILAKQKIGRDNYYVNVALCEVLISSTIRR
jgi:Fic family protein